MSPPCKAQLPRYGASNRQDLHVDFSFSKGRRAHHRQVSTEPPVFFLVHNGPNDSQRSSVSTGLEHDAGGDALLQPGDAGGLGLGPFGAAMRPDRRARDPADPPLTGPRLRPPFKRPSSSRPNCRVRRTTACRRLLTGKNASDWKNHRRFRAQTARAASASGRRAPFP